MRIDINKLILSRQFSFIFLDGGRLVSVSTDVKFQNLDGFVAGVLALYVIKKSRTIFIADETGEGSLEVSMCRTETIGTQIIPSLQ